MCHCNSYHGHGDTETAPGDSFPPYPAAQLLKESLPQLQPPGSVAAWQMINVHYSQTHRPPCCSTAALKLLEHCPLTSNSTVEVVQSYNCTLFLTGLLRNLQQDSYGISNPCNHTTQKKRLPSLLLHVLDEDRLMAVGLKTSFL
jgi:hypothetical protein